MANRVICGPNREFVDRRRVKVPGQMGSIELITDGRIVEARKYSRALGSIRVEGGDDYAGSCIASPDRRRGIINGISSLGSNEILVGAEARIDLESVQKVV